MITAIMALGYYAIAFMLCICIIDALFRRKK